MDLVGVFSSIEDHHMNTVSNLIIMRAATYPTPLSLSRAVESVLRGLHFAAGEQPREGHQSGSARAEEVCAAPQAAH